MSVVTKLGSGSKRSVSRSRRHPGSARRSPVPRSVPVWWCSAPPGTSRRRSSTTPRARRWQPPRRWKPTCAHDGDKTAKANTVGKLLGERAKAAGVSAVVFDRGGYRYHGRVAAVADGCPRPVSSSGEKMSNQNRSGRDRRDGGVARSPSTSSGS